jgi:hypothetical protein
MALVVSVCTSLRTKTCASAAKTAAPRTSIAPSASASDRSAPTDRRGDSTISTPIIPTATAEIRKSRTSSPRNIAAKITVRIGAA